jgi:LmbE family N-acetylglucosaminyl deacetylase
MTLKSVVCFFAHPDDETILAGGMIALLASQGIKVQVVCATRGEGGEVGDPPVATRLTLGQVREAELRCACQALGAGLTILDYVDPTIGPDDVLFPFQADFNALAGQLADIARRSRADVVLTHGADGEYGHPAHQLLHRAVMRGISYTLPNTLIYTVAANVPSIEDRLWNKSEPAHLALDIRPWSAQKIAAMECHLTQAALFKRRRELTSVREALRSTESVRRAWPDTHSEPPDDEFARLLKMAGAWMVN